jgi:aminoglycoside phosphotransferase family enzyme/predicted kinase
MRLAAHRGVADRAPPGDGVEPLPEEIECGLAEPAAYPGDPSAQRGVRTVQTHISHVFLSAERVYKLRKAVDLGFVDFGTREARNRDCLREVRLNRRLAPDVYLGVAPVRIEEGRVRLGPADDALAGPDAAGGVPEHCVVMRRLPEGGDAHAAHGLGAPAPFGPDEWRARIVDPVADNFAALETVGGVSRSLLGRARTAARAFEEKQGRRLEARRQAGHAVDGHGDLHLQHVWFEGDSRQPILIDCIEFSDELRRIDAASEVAFLAMDLVYRGRPRLAERFLRRYARESGDFDLYHVVDYFVAYRAGVRAKVAALTSEEEEVPPEQRRRAADSALRHLALAAQALGDEGQGGLLLVCGVVGTGKSTLAELAADALPGVVISSDRVRKRLAGLSPTQRPGGGWQRGLYTAESTRAVYAALLERAGPVVDSGRTAILDATFAKAGFRDDARAWAQARGMPALLVEARCAPKVVLARLERRAREGRDASDAGPELYERSAAGFEPLDAWPAERRCAVDTDGPEWRRIASAELRRRWSRAREAGAP